MRPCPHHPDHRVRRRQAGLQRPRPRWPRSSIQCPPTQSRKRLGTLTASKPEKQSGSPAKSLALTIATAASARLGRSPNAQWARCFRQTAEPSGMKASQRRTASNHHRAKTTSTYLRNNIRMGPSSMGTGDTSPFRFCQSDSPGISRSSDSGAATKSDGPNRLGPQKESRHATQSRTSIKKPALSPRCRRRSLPPPPRSSPRSARGHQPSRTLW